MQSYIYHFESFLDSNPGLFITFPCIVWLKNMIPKSESKGRQSLTLKQVEVQSRNGSYD